VFTGDFMPYASDYNAYWTGYYTSRPYLKGLTRQSKGVLKLAETWNAVVNTTDEPTSGTADAIQYFRDANAIVQHHDGVSGTEKQFVANDYAVQLLTGRDKINAVLSNLTAATMTLPVASLQPPSFSNTSAAVRDITADTSVPVILHNTLAWYRSEWVSVAVSRSDLKVVDTMGVQVESQVDDIPVWAVDPQILVNQPSDTKILRFFASDIPPMGYSTFFIQQSATVSDKQTSFQTHSFGNHSNSVNQSLQAISNEFYSVLWDPLTGRLAAIQNKESGISSALSSDLVQYIPVSNQESQPSGAYVFNPVKDNIIFMRENSDGGVMATPLPSVVTYSDANSLVFRDSAHASAAGKAINASIPVVLVSALSFMDPTYAFAVSAESYLQFARVFAYRLDQRGFGWGGNAAVANFLQFNATNSSPNDGWEGFQFGSVDVSAPDNAANACAVVNVQFTTAFPDNLPFVHCTVHLTSYDLAAYICSFISVSAASAQALVCRADAPEWPSHAAVSVDWMAWHSATVSLPQGVQFGKAIVDVSSLGANNTVVNTVVTLPLPAVNAAATAMLTSVVAYDSNLSLAATASNLQFVSGANCTFQLNIACSNATDAVGFGCGVPAAQVEVHWILFLQTTYQIPVVSAGTPVNTTSLKGPYVQSLYQHYQDGYGVSFTVFSSATRQSSHTSSESNAQHHSHLDDDFQSQLNSHSQLRTNSHPQKQHVKRSAQPKSKGNEEKNYVDATAFVQVQYHVGPILSGRELVGVLKSDVRNDGIFYTDSNALETRKRTYDWTKSSVISANYYPAVGYSYIQGPLNETSGNVRMYLASDRTHGMTSQRDGELEVMLTRRCLEDDNFGVDEVMDDTDLIQPAFRLLLDTENKIGTQGRKVWYSLEYPLLPLFAQTPVSNQKYVQYWSQNFLTQTSLLQQQLPANVNILSFEVRNKNQNNETYIIRLQHVYEAGESDIYSNPVVLDLNSLFLPQYFSIEAYTEMTLTANIAKQSLRKLIWIAESDSDQDKLHDAQSDEDESRQIGVVTLLPREIKTFMATKSMAK
jgi:hypothetical protein